MTEIERRPGLLYAQPTSGFRRWIGDVAISVPSPSVQLRNRFDSYRVEINDSSISLRIEWPIHRYLERAEQGQPVASPATRALVLGADAQTTSWAYVLVDFPFLMKSTTPAAKAIAAAQSNVETAEMVLCLSAPIRRGPASRTLRSWWRLVIRSVTGSCLDNSGRAGTLRCGRRPEQGLPRWRSKS